MEPENQRDREPSFEQVDIQEVGDSVSRAPVAKLGIEPDAFQERWSIHFTRLPDDPDYADIAFLRLGSGDLVALVRYVRLEDAGTEVHVVDSLDQSKQQALVDELLEGLGLDRAALTWTAPASAETPDVEQVREGHRYRPGDHILDIDGWQLESGVEHHATAPETFEIPSEEIRHRLFPGSDAKLIFTLRTEDGRIAVERMWVRVTGYTDDAYEGVLNSDPETAGVPLSSGDRVNFRPDHVIDALPPENWDAATGSYGHAREQRGLEVFRDEMNSVWDEAQREAERRKDSQSALDRLHHWYGRLGSDERTLADKVIEQWLLSDVEAKRFDGAALARDFKIKSAVPALHQLSVRLAQSEDPGAPFERDKIENLITALTANGND
jgi:hypothetical protein